MKNNFHLTLLILLLLFGCNENDNQNPLDKVLASEDPRIKSVMDNLENHEVQIRFTQIDRINDSLVFTDYDFQVDANNYFYPASTVKFPAAVATLEKLNSIDSLNQNSVFFVEGDSVKTTFSKAIEEIFAVSDNAANNRLIEFLGFDGLNNSLQHRGVTPVRIAHRLSTSNADDIVTKPLVFYLNDSTTSLSNSIIGAPPIPLKIDNLKKGKGFYSDGPLINEPFDFSLKNHYPIEAQSNLLKRILFPEAFEKTQQFDLSEEQQEFLKSTMAKLPHELGYNREEFYDSYVKFFMYGDSEEPILKHIKIYNKVGYAYGTLTDCAYIKDEKNKVDFMLVATILVNKDEIFNDDNYDYEEVGIPFLAQLGRELYEIELERNK